MTTAAQSKRKYICGTIIENLEDIVPLSGVGSLSGIRVYQVGQGDAVAVLEDKIKPVIQIDYGGKVSNPFTNMALQQDVDDYLPVKDVQLVMLTHWDEDHWCSANRADLVKNERKWLVPRQVTSPRAVEFSTLLENRISCIPDNRSKETFFFEAANGDHICWEKIAPSKLNAKGEENCNNTGVAFSIVKAVEGRPNKVILAPGDAPFHKVKHYRELLETGAELVGIIAYHHGAETHWTKETTNMLEDWKKLANGDISVVYSYGRENSYGHPIQKNYKAVFGDKYNGDYTERVRDKVPHYIDIMF